MIIKICLVIFTGSLHACVMIVWNQILLWLFVSVCYVDKYWFVTEFWFRLSKCCFRGCICCVLLLILTFIHKLSSISYLWRLYFSDFLPIRCDACKKDFCGLHYSYDAHCCQSSYKKVSFHYLLLLKCNFKKVLVTFLFPLYIIWMHEKGFFQN